MKILDNTVDIMFDIKRAPGYGVHFIIADICYKNKSIKLPYCIRNTELTDKYYDLKDDNVSYEEIQQFLYDISFNFFEDDILEFCYNIDNN